MMWQFYIIFYSGGYCRGGVQEGEKGEIRVRVVQPLSTANKGKGDVVMLYNPLFWWMMQRRETVE